MVRYNKKARPHFPQERWPLFGWLALLIICLTAACSSTGGDKAQGLIVESPTVEARPLEEIAAIATTKKTPIPEAPDEITPEFNDATEESRAGDGAGNENQAIAETGTSDLASPEPGDSTPKSSPGDQTATPEVTTEPTAELSTPTRVITQAVPIGATPTGRALSIDPTQINGIPFTEFVVMDDGVKQHVKEIYAAGQAQGRFPDRFSKLGDSLIATPDFLTQFDRGLYNLGAYSFLQPAIDYFAGSYERYGVALRPGLHAWGVFDPLWADKEWCQPNEDLLACEFRLNNPAVLLILLGTNDSGSPDGFDYNMRKVVEFSIENGVIPVIATKADRFEGPENTNNIILRQIAADFQIPLWDFDLIADTLPDRGLKEDQVHLTIFLENDYTMPEAFQSGHGTHNLSALMLLESVRRLIVED